MYGIPYYHSIPLKYQTTMCKNINSLVKYKSCKQGMLNLISLFGMDDIQIFKYFILRDRNTDAWGDFIYNTTTNVSSKENDIIIHKQETATISTNTIPFPFAYFLEKGNVMFVRLDGYRLVEGTDYQIYNGNFIEFLNGIDSGKSTITYDFYYDKTTITTDYLIDTENGVNILTTTITNTDDSNTFTITPPYPEYFIDGNNMIVSVGGVFIDSTAYTFNITNNQLIIDDTYVTEERIATIIFLYGKGLSTKFKKYNVAATTNNQTVFTIPEPFINYVTSGNSFFVTIGSTYIDSRRYTISGNTFALTDTSISLGRQLSFYFIYAQSSIYAPITLTKSVQTITATKNYQYEFDLKLPIENYLKLGYKVYVKLRGWFLSDEYYDVYTTKIVFNDRSIALQRGETMEIHYVYGPSSNTDNIVVLRKYITAETAYQSTFDISYPLTNYFTKGNKLIVDIDGTLLNESDYTFNNDYTKITITDTDYLPYTGQKVNYIFIYNKDNDKYIEIDQQVLTATTSGKQTFTIKFPFYPYLETGQGIILLKDSVMIHSDRITISDKYNITIDMDDLVIGDEIIVLFIYNKDYLVNSSDWKLTVVEKTVPISLTINDDLYIDIPVPFDDYFENDWCYFIDYNKNILTEDYEIIDTDFIFTTPKDIINYNSMTFVFIYKDTYLIEEEGEDYTKDIDLKFVKIPLKTNANVYYIKQKADTKSYNSVTLADKFWDGENNQDNAHEAIKLAILKKEFNYARTKYMTVDYVVELTDLSFGISYFYNMLYDDVFKEDLLTVQIPNISANKNFKLSYIFCYMTALAYLFSGIEDNIMDTPTKVLYVKGFNFSADLTALKNYILKERRLPSDYDVFGFKIPTDQIPSITDFIKIYTTNKDIYQTICAGMVEARNYDIYKIWKKLYDSLMIWKFNLKFFQLSDGTTASSFTKFLKEKDNVLYTSLKTISAISDQETRENTIVNTISDIIYILEKYLDSKTFKFIYNHLPGTSGEYILQYLFTMINFFKSYKVVLNQMNIQYNLDDKNQNTIRIYDTQAMTISLNKPDYITINESKSSTNTLKKSETIGFKEKISFSYTQSS
jgi:hypothetical protein